MDNETVESVERECGAIRRRIIMALAGLLLSLFGLAGLVVAVVVVIGTV